MRFYFFALVALVPALPIVAVDPLRRGVVAHEWGTFTTVAAEDGKPVQWRPILSSDLPCFVERDGPFNPKGMSATFVRMETPVIYFYAPSPAVVDVRVDFPHGRMTEWYPKATTRSHTQLIWNAVRIDPRESGELPASKGASHYFAARETDAAPVRVNGQVEKLLFYRGVGNFDVPIEAKFLGDGRLRVRNTGSTALPVAFYFENREGRVAYRVARDVSREIVWESPKGLDNLVSIQQAFRPN